LKDHELKVLEERIGPEHLRKRLEIERSYHDKQVTFGYWVVNSRFARGLERMVELAFRATGLWAVGRRHALDYRLTRHAMRPEGLPQAFRGFTILHLSDLHIEGIEDGGASLRRLIEGAPADLCVITGDFRYENAGVSDEAIARMRRLLGGLAYREGIYAVLGNHDALDLVRPFEEMGIRVLLNEAVPIRRSGETLWLCGVDDPHFFQMHDLERTLAGVPEGGFKVLLAHSPDIVELAAAAGIEVYLCGHAHGGQICLPGGIPLIANLRCARTYFRGPWAHGRMQGYTSHGTGASGVPVRLFSRPEVIVHRLDA
jgi:hypothetical protein